MPGNPPAPQPAPQPAPAAPTTSPKPPVIPSPAEVVVAANQSAAAPTPTVKVNQPLPTVSHANLTSVPIAPAAVTPASNVSQIKITPTSPLVTNSSSGKSLSTQAGLSDLPKGSSLINHNSTDSAFLGNYSSKGVTLAISLSAVAILLGVLVTIKIISSYCRKRKGSRRLNDTFIVVPTTPPASRPKNQAHGGVGASPAPTIFTSKTSSTCGSPRLPTHHQNKNSLILSNDYGSFHPYTRQDSHISMAEYIQPGHHFAESKAWDGSRPSPALVWR